MAPSSAEVTWPVSASRFCACTAEKCRPKTIATNMARCFISDPVSLLRGRYPRQSASTQLSLPALIEAGDIDHDALVRAVADGLFFVAGLDPKRKRAAVDGGQLGGGSNSHTDRRGSEMPDVEMNAEAL